MLVRSFNEFNVRVGLPPTFNTFSQARSTVRMAAELDPHGAWIAVLNRRKVVGVAISFRRGDYVSVGPVGVHPLMQGRGIGRRLMRAIGDANADATSLVLAHSGANPHAYALYRSLGYKVVYAEVTFVGVPAAPPPAPDDVREAGESDLAAVKRLDAELSCVDRSREIEVLAGLGRVLVTEVGYLACVRLGDSLAVGPGAAREPAAMRALVGAAMQDLPPGGLICRVPANGAAYDEIYAARLVPESIGNIMAAGRWLARTGEHVHPVFPEVL